MPEKTIENIQGLREKYYEPISKWIGGPQVRRTLISFRILPDTDDHRILDGILDDDAKFLDLLALFYATFHYNPGTQKVLTCEDFKSLEGSGLKKWQEILNSKHPSCLYYFLAATQSDNPHMMVKYNNPPFWEA